jgi:hypothetical protein
MDFLGTCTCGAAYRKHMPGVHAPGCFINTTSPIAIAVEKVTPNGARQWLGVVYPKPKE